MFTDFFGKRKIFIFSLAGGLTDLYSNFFNKITLYLYSWEFFAYKLFFSFCNHCSIVSWVKETLFELRYPIPLSDTRIVLGKLKNVKQTLFFFQSFLDFKLTSSVVKYFI